MLTTVIKSVDDVHSFSFSVFSFCAQYPVVVVFNVVFYVSINRVDKFSQEKST